MAEALADRGAVVTGIDPAADAVDAARRHAAATGRAIRDDVGLGAKLPYHDKAFAAAVWVDVLEHVADMGKVPGELERILSQGDYFSSIRSTVTKSHLSQRSRWQMTSCAFCQKAHTTQGSSSSPPSFATR
jgi:2-polyprenyl-6-hydroxyphenyl methylase/3-demethylubiquinone-9 3-methyltransferase